LARPTEVGARALVHGASVGLEGHGQYFSDCKITPTAGLAKGQRGIELQTRVWEELRQKLEVTNPGIITGVAGGHTDVHVIEGHNPVQTPAAQIKILA